MTRSTLLPVVIGLAVVAVVAVLAVAVLTRPSAAVEPVARLGTADVHSLSFVGDDARHILFGHHGGVLESIDGGRTWTDLAAREDAMGMGAADDGSIVIAGHDVFSRSADGGRTWVRIPTDLPDLDIHGFTRDPADPSRMWAALASGGLWESRDGGGTFEQVDIQNVLLPVAFDEPSGPRLMAITASGLATSADAGRTWAPLGDPGLYPIATLAATADGTTLVAGGPDGLRRSGDGGRSWTDPGFRGDPFAAALSRDGRTVGLVTQSGEFFRSDDGGTTWASP